MVAVECVAGYFNRRGASRADGGVGSAVVPGEFRFIGERGGEIKGAPVDQHSAAFADPRAAVGVVFLEYAVLPGEFVAVERGRYGYRAAVFGGAVVRECAAVEIEIAQCHIYRAAAVGRCVILLILAAAECVAGNIRRRRSRQHYGAARRGTVALEHAFRAVAARKDCRGAAFGVYRAAVAVGRVVFNVIAGERGVFGLEFRHRARVAAQKQYRSAVSRREAVLYLAVGEFQIAAAQHNRAAAVLDIAGGYAVGVVAVECIAGDFGHIADRLNIDGAARHCRVIVFEQAGFRIGGILQAQGAAAAVAAALRQRAAVPGRVVAGEQAVEPDQGRIIHSYGAAAVFAVIIQKLRAVEGRRRADVKFERAAAEFRAVIIEYGAVIGVFAALLHINRAALAVFVFVFRKRAAAFGG